MGLRIGAAAARTALGALMALALGTGIAGNARADCGSYEDETRASYRELRWEDFRGPRPPRKRHGMGGRPAIQALIATSVRVDALEVVVTPLANGEWLARPGQLCIRAYGLKDRSGHHREQTMRRELAHEQGHFDVSKLAAQALRLQLAGLEQRASSPEQAERELREQAREVYREAMAESQRLQERYERETRYGNRRNIQERWGRELRERIATTPIAVDSAD